MVNTMQTKREGGPLTLGQKIQRLLDTKKISQSAFADKVGMGRTELNRSINGRRQFRPDEINWIAAALEVPVDELLDGVELPASVAKMRGELESLTERVLQAEADRDRMKAELNAVEAAHEDERAQWRQERESLRQASAVERQRAERELVEARRVGALREKHLEAALSAAQSNVAEGREVLARSRAEAAKLQISLARLQEQLRTTQDALAQERSSKVATSVLTGLAGALLGGVLGSGRSNDDDDDDDDDDDA